jgi:hypothetical protein
LVRRRKIHPASANSTISQSERGRVALVQAQPGSLGAGLFAEGPAPPELGPASPPPLLPPEPGIPGPAPIPIPALPPEEPASSAGTHAPDAQRWRGGQTAPEHESTHCPAAQ